MAADSAVARVVFREIVPGDLRKVEADAQDAGTGGGARDLRFRPYEKFAPVFSVLLPERVPEMRKRGGERVPVELSRGKLYWLEEEETRSAEAVFEPPTDARPGEGRLTCVHNVPPLRELPERDGRFVLLLVQDGAGRVWPHVVTDTSLRGGEWDDAVAQPIVKCLDAAAGRKSVCAGYIDLTNDTRYCNASVL